MIQKKHTLNFNNFEYFIPDADIAVYRQRIEAGAVIKANQISKNCWTYSLKEEGALIDCEVIYSSLGLKSYTCGCGSKDIKKPCVHVLILLFWHIHKILKRNLSKSQVYEVKDFEHLQTHELIHIIQVLGSINEVSKIWVSFIGILIKDKKSGYTAISELISENMKQIRKLYKNEASVLKYMLMSFREVYQIALMAFRDNESERAIILLTSGLHHSYVFSSSLQTFSKSKFNVLTLKIQAALDEIVPTIIAPHSRQRISQLLFNVITDVHYYALNFDSNLFQLLHKLNIKKVQKIELNTQLSLRIKSTLSDELKLLHMDILYTIDADYFVNHLTRWLQEQSIPSYIVSNWLNSRQGKVFNDHAISLYKILFPLLTKDLKNYSLPYILNYYSRANGKAVDMFLIDLYYELDSIPSLELFDKLYSIREFSPEKILVYLQLKHQSLHSLNKLMADIYKSIKDWENLVSTLRNSNDIYLIMQYDSHLPVSHRMMLKDIYLRNLIEIKNNYGGQESNKMIQFIIAHFKSIFDAANLAELKTHFQAQTNYKAERNSLK